MYYAFTKKSVMVEIAKILKRIKIYESGYAQEEIEQLAAEMEMSGQSDDITISEEFWLIDGGRRLLAAQLLGHTHIRAKIVKIEEQHIRKLMRSLNFTRDKKNFEKIKEALLIYKEVERHQGKKTSDKRTPIQIAINRSGVETSETNFYKIIFIDQTEHMYPGSNLMQTIERGDLKIDKAYQKAKELRAIEKERLRLLEEERQRKLDDDKLEEKKKESQTATSVPLADTITQTTDDSGTKTIDAVESAPLADNTITQTTSGSVTETTDAAETTPNSKPQNTTIIFIPKRKHSVLSPQCHIINESNNDIQEIENDSLDFSWQSPPYWQQSTYGNTDELGKEKTSLEYLNNLLKTYEALYPKMKMTGNLLVNLKGTFQIMKNHNIEEWFKIRMGEMGWYLMDTLIWVRGVGKQSSKVDKAPENAYEPIFWFVKSKDYYYRPYAKKIRTEPIEFTIKNVKRTDKNGTTTTPKIFLNRAFKAFENVIYENDFNDVWTTKASSFEKGLLNKYYGEHPAPFPMCLSLLPALQFCPPNGRMLDSFMGRGAGLIPSMMLGQTVYGYELNSEYFETAKTILSDIVADIDLYRQQMNELLLAA